MVDPLNVNRRSTEIPFPFIYLFLCFFHKEWTSKARSGGGGGGGEGCGRTRRTPLAIYGLVLHPISPELVGSK